MAQRILALEVAGDEVRAAVGERTWSSLELIGVFKEQRAGDEPDAEAALRRLLERVGTPDIVLSALPGELAARRLLELPFHDRRHLDQAVPFALEEHLPFAVDEGVVGYAPVGRGGDHTLVMAAMARKDDIRSHLKLLARAGLDPKTLTLSALSLPALLSRIAERRTCPHLVLDIDHRHASLLLLDETGAPRAMRTLSASLEAGNGRPGLGAEGRAVLEAVRQVMLAHTCDLGRPDLIVTGPLRARPEVERELSEELQLEVRGADQADCSPSVAGLNAAALDFASCVSMLLGELPAAPARLLNFRQGEFAFRGWTGDLAPLRLSGMLAAVVAAMALIHLVLGITTSAHRVRLLQRQIAAVAAGALGPGAPANPKAALLDGIARMNKQLKLMGGSGALSPLDALLAVSRAIPAHLAIDLDEMSIDDSGLGITGKADSFATIDEVKKALQSSANFRDIQVADAKASATHGKVEFRLSAAVK